MRKAVLTLAFCLLPFFFTAIAFPISPFDLARILTPPIVDDWYDVYADNEYIYQAEMGITIWGRSNFQFVATLSEDPSGTMYSVFADSDYVYGASSDNNVYVWNRTAPFALVRTLTEGTSTMRSVFADSDYIYAGGSDDNVYVWNRSVFSLNTTLTESQPLGAIYSVHADCSYIYAGGLDEDIYIWDRATLSFNTFSPLTVGPSEDVTSVYSKPGTFIYASTEDGNVYAWDRDTLALNTNTPVTADAGLSDMFVGDTYIFGAGEDHNIYVWDRLTFGEERILSPPVADPTAEFRSVFADYQYIYGGSEAPAGNDENLYIWYLTLPAGQTVLGALKNQGGDQNLYQYYSPEPFTTSQPFASGDWTYWDATARNPSPYYQARDLWAVPQGNNIVAAAPLDIDGDGYDEIGVMRNQGGDYNFYVYESLVTGFDNTFWDALARNPSPIARDFWFIPAGNNTIMMAGVDGDGDGFDEVALLKNEWGGQKLYYYNCPRRGEMIWAQAFVRNGLGPYAYDAWYVPAGSNIVTMAGVDGLSDASPVDQLVTIKNQGGNYNLYVWMAPNEADTYNTELTNRFLQNGFGTPGNPTGLGNPQAQDDWIVPERNDIVGITAVRSDDGTYDALGVMENLSGDYNYYLWKLPVKPEHTYDDNLFRQYGRNEFRSAQARDFWAIPGAPGGATQFLLGITQ